MTKINELQCSPYTEYDDLNKWEKLQGGESNIKCKVPYDYEFDKVKSIIIKGSLECMLPIDVGNRYGKVIMCRAKGG